MEVINLERTNENNSMLRKIAQNPLRRTIPRKFITRRDFTVQKIMTRKIYRVDFLYTTRTVYVLLQISLLQNT